MPNNRAPDERKPANPKADRLIAMAIWVVTGLLFGLAVSVFLGQGGWLWLGIGLVAGVLAAIFRTRPQQTIEED